MLSLRTKVKTDKGEGYVCSHTVASTMSEPKYGVMLDSGEMIRDLVLSDIEAIPVRESYVCNVD